MKKCGTVGLCIGLVLLSLVLSCCNSSTEYYREQENYIQASGNLYYFVYSEELSAYYLAFSELSPKFDDDCFKIEGKNAQIVKEMGIEEQLQIGMKVCFMTAPRYFGDGYVYPIVAISIGDTVLLDFETGYSNFVNWIDK